MMIDWISNNLIELLGTGGIGAIIVVIITKRNKNNAGTKVSQKMKSGDNSSSYQSGGNITINADRKDDKDV